MNFHIKCVHINVSQLYHYQCYCYHVMFLFQGIYHNTVKCFIFYISGVASTGDCSNDVIPIIVLVLVAVVVIIVGVVGIIIAVTTIKRYK